jgi:hypothetical protein
VDTWIGGGRRRGCHWGKTCRGGRDIEEARELEEKMISRTKRHTTTEGDTNEYFLICIILPQGMESRNLPTPFGCHVLKLCCAVDTSLMT